MTASRLDVVAEAFTWLGTPYHHEADVKGVGVDCAMLPVRVFCDLGLLPAFDPRPYPAQWHLHKGSERYLEWVRKYSKQVQTPGLGDLILFRYGRTLSHSGIVVSVDPTVMIHAYISEGCVLAGIAEKDYSERLDSYWSVFA